MELLAERLSASGFYTSQGVSVELMSIAGLLILQLRLQGVRATTLLAGKARCSFFFSDCGAFASQRLLGTG